MDQRTLTRGPSVVDGGSDDARRPQCLGQRVIVVVVLCRCGKSLAVKAIGSCFNLPLYRINMIDIFSGRHGNPEATFVAACRTMEEMAPAVHDDESPAAPITAVSM